MAGAFRHVALGAHLAADLAGGNLLAGGGHALGVLVALRAETARDVVARAVAEEEPEGLNHGHHGKRDAHGPVALVPTWPTKNVSAML